MAISRGDTVKFVYTSGSSLPSKVDDATIYVLGGSQELYVGSLKIAANIDIDSILSNTSTNPVENQAITKELNKKATIESPTFTGIPNASTAAEGTSTTQIATTAFVQNAVTAATIVVDDALNSTSTNPVQNKVIKAVLDAKANLDSPTFTGTPTAPTATKGTNTTQVATTSFIQNELVDYVKANSSVPIAYGVCTDVGDVVNKTITLINADGWSLEVGSIVVVKHTNKNTALNPTFNVNDTGNVPVGYNTSDGNDGWCAGEANVTSVYVYNGTSYMWLTHSVDNDTTYTPATLGQGYATCTPPASGIAMTAALSKYALVAGGIVSVKFSTNNVPASATLSINSKTAKAIYWKGVAIPANTILAGDTATFIYNGQYHLIAIDRWGNEATSSNDGLMSAADKTKLDTIESGANKTLVDDTISSTSTNPVQNKVVKQAIDDAIAASDAMVFKGTLGTGGTITSLPTTYSVGWTYRVITAGTYAGNVCEVGDLIIALVSRSGNGNTNTDWTVAQTNIDGAITNITGTSPISVTGSGTDRTIAHADSGVTAASKGDTTNKTPAFGGTFKVPSATVDAKGHLTALADHTVKIPDTEATTSASGLMSATDKTKLDGVAEGANAYTHPSYTSRTGKPTANQTPAFGDTVIVSQITSDASGHVTGATDRTITIPNAEATTSASGLMSSTDKTKLDGIADIPVPIASGGTSATTKKDAANSLEVISLAHGTEIPVNTDLNTISTVGNYYCSTIAKTETLINCPSGRSFKMEVGRSSNSGDDTGYLYQKITRFDTGAIYYRYNNASSFNTSKWSAWRDYSAYLPLTGGTIAPTTATSVNVGNKNMLADVKDASNGITSSSVSSNARHLDKNGELVSVLENRFEPNGDVKVRLGVRNWKTSTSELSSYNRIDLGMDKAGDPFCEMSYPKVIRNQLGIAYGTCSTAADIAAKEVVVGYSSYKLSVGSYVAVKFTNTNTASRPTLNVNGTGAKSVVYDTDTITSSNLKYAGIANIVMYYVYDGTNWVWLGQSQDELANSGVASGSYGPSENATPSVSETFDVPYITVDTKGRVTAASTKTVTMPSDSTKADLVSPTFTGTPKAPTAAVGTNTTQIATTAFVNTAVGDAIAASDAMIFKGTLGIGGTITALPTTYKTGWTYRVITAGTYAGNTCEVGDLIIALTNRSGSGNVNADWTVAQTNINGAITSITGTSPIVSSGSGSSRTLSHADSGVTAASKGDTTNQTPAFGGTFKVPSATVDAKGHLTALDEHTVKIPNTTATTSANGLMSSTDKTKLDSITATYTAVTGKPTANQTPAFGGTATISQVSQSATGQVSVTDRTIKIPNATATTSVAGLMSADDKTKLDGIATGAEVNSITGVKGNAESSYRTGNVNLTPANVGALALTGGTITNGTTAARVENMDGGLDATLADNGITATRYPTNFRLMDKNGNAVCGIEGCETTSGEIYMDLISRNYNTTTSAWSGYQKFGIYTNKSGQYGYRISAPTALKNAIGIVYGTCDTAAATAAKVVTVDGIGFALSTGAIIGVKFTATNTANNPTLNINNTGAKKVWYDTALITTSNQKFAGEANRVTFFMYDGTQWVWIGHGANDATGYLPLTGGTVSGATTVQDTLTLYREGTTEQDLPAQLRFSVKDTTTDKAYTSATISAYQDHGATTYGTNMVIQSGGSMILGSGESPASQYSALKGDTGAYSGEDTWIVADSTINLQANANSIANRKGARITTAGAIVPIVADIPTNNVQSVGTADYKWNSMYATTFYGTLSGNASTATEFSANKAVTLTGDVTGTASSKGGWSVATTLANSGVTAGSYGPSANATPAVGATFNVPYITVDAKGRLTAASTKTVTIPSDSTKANLASPTFTGTPKAPTATSGTNNTQIATTAFVNTAVTNAALPKTTSTPQANVDSTTGVIGTETKYAAGDHQHPAQTYVDSVRHVGAVNVATAIAANRIGVYDPTAGGYVQLAANVEFSLNWPILYFPTAAAVGSYTNARLTYPAAANSGASSMTVGRQTWLRLLLTSEIDRTVIYVSTVKTVADTKTNPYIYIPLGVASTSSAIYFNPAQYGSVLINQPGYIVG